MQVMREYKKVKNSKVLINLPKEMEGKKVEVIILPFDTTKEKLSLNKLLLNGPTFGAAEIKSMRDVRTWMDKWKMKQF